MSVTRTPYPDGIALFRSDYGSSQSILEGIINVNGYHNYKKRNLRFLKPDDSVVRLFFDVLHGIDRADIPLVVALEFAILLGYDGQLKQNSDMEKELFQCTIEQLHKTKMTKIENALMWLYVKTWGLQGQHVFDKYEMWNFGGEDLEEAIIGRGHRTYSASTQTRQHRF